MRVARPSVFTLAVSPTRYPLRIFHPVHSAPCCCNEGCWPEHLRLPPISPLARISMFFIFSVDDLNVSNAVSSCLLFKGDSPFSGRKFLASRFHFNYGYLLKNRNWYRLKILQSRTFAKFIFKFRLSFSIQSDYIDRPFSREPRETAMFLLNFQLISGYGGHTSTINSHYLPPTETRIYSARRGHFNVAAARSHRGNVTD